MSNLHRGRGSRGGGGGPPRGRGTESPAGSQTSSTGGGYTRGRGNSPAPGGIFTGGNRGGGRGGARGGPPQIFGPSPARVDSRLSTSSALVASFKRLDVQDKMPLRPGWGTKGQPRVVRANFFAVRIPKDLTIYEYDVTISPEKEPTSKKKGTASGGPQDKDQKQQAAGLRARLFQLLEQHPDFQPYVGHIAHDRSKKIVSARLLPAPLSIRVTHFHEEEAAPRPNSLVYVMNISFTTGVDSNSLTQSVI